MKIFFSVLTAMVFFLSTSHNGNAKEAWITVGSDLAHKGQKLLKSAFLENENYGEISVIKVEENDLPLVSQMAHEEFNRCGGFVFHESREEAIEMATEVQNKSFAKGFTFADYDINQQDFVTLAIKDVEPVKILDTIKKLSTFQNRYYAAAFGKQSQEWVKSTWEKLVEGRSDAQVDYYVHPSFPQPSVVLTIKGKSDEKIIIGGHADSISGYFGRATARAPGADDNASGIATITEIIRVLVKHSYQPEKTLMFMAYAAEEVGLRGSSEIAKKMKDAQSQVAGVLQLDMTNFKGSNDEIVLMTDYTNEAQNNFLGKLIDTYVKLKWGQDKCGYACSDHASWYSNGFPASIPFESHVKEMNNQIHTANDTLSRSSDNAEHASKFARLGLSFVIELDR